MKVKLSRKLIKIDFLIEYLERKLKRKGYNLCMNLKLKHQILSNYDYNTRSILS